MRCCDDLFSISRGGQFQISLSPIPSERRAAERAAHKAGKAEKLNGVNPPSPQVLPAQAELAMAAVASANGSSCPSDIDLDASVLLAPELEGFETGMLDPEIQAITDRIEKVPVPRFKADLSREQPSKRRDRFDLMSHTNTHRFSIVNWESPLEMEILVQSFESEYAPKTDSERRLVDMMARHYWLMQRALILQERLMPNDLSSTTFDPNRFALFMRYHDSHERSYYRAAHELQKLRQRKEKEEIGFESQKRKTAAEERDEQRKQELNQSRVRLNNVRSEGKELDTTIRQIFEAPELGLVPPKFLKNPSAGHPSAPISRTGV